MTMGGAAGGLAVAAAASTTNLVVQSLNAGGGNANISISSSQSQLFGLARIHRAGHSLKFPSSARDVARAVRASSSDESGKVSRKDAVRNGNGGGMERRQLLVASTAAAAAGLAGGSKLVLPASAEPVLAPDLTKCIPSTDDRLKAEGIASVQCCPPYPGVTIKDFKFPAPLPAKLRKPAHLLSDKEAATYEKAYASIAALPASDPRSFTAQANVHCAYCNYGYFQQDGVTPLQVHASWLFFPFHRWYLYFHERILAKFANDPTFALPYWNWDNQDVTNPVPNTIPLVFLQPDKYPTLSKAIRNTDHYPPNLVDFTRGSVPQTNPSGLREANTAALYQNIVSGAKTASLFFGGAYRAGDKETPGGGTVEGLPHGPVHGWTGGTGGAGEDMGNFYSAGRDPSFYSHHSNVDRMWAVWKTLPGGSRKDITDPDWLNATFLLYDENADLVRVKVGDCLDTTKLGYSFAPSADRWKSYQPTSTTASAKTANYLVPGGAQGAAALAADEDGPSFRRGPGRGEDGDRPRRPLRRREDLPEFGRKKREIDAEEGFAFTLARPERPQRRGRRGPPGSKSRSLEPLPPTTADDDDDEEEILVIEGVTVPTNRLLSFDVFLNLPNADKTTPLTAPEYVGTYYNVPHTAPGGKTETKTNLRMGVSDTLKLLKITDANDLVVTLVPRETDEPVTVTNVRIEYE